MNMNDGITNEHMRALFAAADDDAAHHILWVDNDGEVHLQALEEGRTPAGFAHEHQKVIRFRLETFTRGNGYVGTKVSTDAEYVDKMRRNLQTLWDKNEVGYIDVFPHGI